MPETTRMVLAGEGGQGVQTVAEILAEAANDKGKQVIYIPNFGVEQRGGVSVAFVQVSDEAIGSPKFDTADIVVALSDRAVQRTKQYIGPETTIVYDSGIEDIEVSLNGGTGEVLPIPSMEVAKKELSPRVFNIVIMGAVVCLSGVISLDQAKEAIEKKLFYKFEKKPELRDLNYRALERGCELVHLGLGQFGAARPASEGGMTYDN